MLALLTPFSLDAQSAKDPSDNSLDSLYRGVMWRNIGPFRGGRSNCASGVVGDTMQTLLERSPQVTSRLDELTDLLEEIGR